MSSSAATLNVERSRSGQLARHALWLAPLLLALGPTVAWLFERWTLSVWYNGHGIFVPLIVAYLVWDDAQREPDLESRASAWGFAFLVPGLGLVALDAAIHSELLAAFGLVTCLPGLSLLVLGVERTRRLIFPLVIAYFMLPIPAGLISKVYLVLREITAIGTAEIVPLFGIPLLREGTLLFIPRLPVDVADSCSGFSTMYASVTTGLILAHLTPSRARGLFLVAASVVLALVCNIVRVTILVLAAQYFGGEILATYLHEGSGMAAFAVAISVLIWLGGRDVFGPPRAAEGA